MLAEHFLRGQDRERAAYWYRRSAEQALDRNDMQSVLSRAGQALELETQSEPLGQLHGLMAEALYWSVQLSEAQRHARTAVEKKCGAARRPGFISRCASARQDRWATTKRSSAICCSPPLPSRSTHRTVPSTPRSAAWPGGHLQLPWASRHHAANQAIAAMDVLWQSRVQHSAHPTGRVQQARAVQALHTSRDLERAPCAS